MKATPVSIRYKAIVILVTTTSIAFRNIGGYIRVLFRFYVSDFFGGGILFEVSGKEI